MKKYTTIKLVLVLALLTKRVGVVVWDLDEIEGGEIDGTKFDI